MIAIDIAEAAGTRSIPSRSIPGEPGLRPFVELERVLIHPWVTTEIALGNVRDRVETLRDLERMESADVVSDGPGSGGAGGGWYDGNR